MRDAAGTIDLNADLGEGFPWDEQLLELVTSASISCGAHAGDAETIRKTLELARRRGTLVGAHPGYHDREHFGRREQSHSPSDAHQLVQSQIRALRLIADEVGVVLRFLKPHGALYNQAQREIALARALVQTARDEGLAVVGQPGSQVEAAARQSAATFVSEGFIDRRYQPDGRLTPRTDPRALLEDPSEISAQTLQLSHKGIETLCIHGDHANCVALARLARNTLENAGVTIRSFA
jgi:UPF0271 protein